MNVNEWLWIMPYAEDVKAMTARGIEAECCHDRVDYTGKRVVVVTPPGNLYLMEKAPEVGRYVLENGALDLKYIHRIPVNGKPDPDFFGKWRIEAMEKELEHASGLPPEPKESAPRVGTGQPQPIVRNSGLWASCLHNSKLWLEDPSRGMVIRYDRFVRTVLVNGKPLSDEMVIATAAGIEAEKMVPWNQEHVRSAMLDVAHRNEFSSLTEYLNGLEWDRVGRIDHFFRDAYGCQETEYAIACARVLFLSAVARAFEPGCQSDVMVVLIGAQGVGKSMGISSLVPNPDWYTDDLPDLYDRKAAENLRGKWVIEFSEFSRINRSTIEVVKSFLTRRVDQYRPSYGRLAEDFPRSCIFVGTTNDPHPLQDAENRRFMPITCGQGKPEWIRANRDQLWAEAVDRYRRGEQWWVSDASLLTEVGQQQEEARQVDCWESILEDKLRFRANFTMEEAADALGIKPDRLDRSTQIRVGNNLKKIGYVRTRVRNSNGLAWVYNKP